MSYNNISPGGLNYQPCRYGGSRVMFRGPPKPLEGKFIAFFGSTKTYGKFVERPFPALLEERLNVVCANFGRPNAGVELYLNEPFLRDVATRAAVTVIQVVSPRNMNNRLYTVHPRRNDRFVKPTRLLKSLYDDVDFADCNFNKHMLQKLHATSPERFESIVNELREAWQSRMRLLCSQIPGKTVLFYFSDRRPDTGSVPNGTEPWFVTKSMLNDIQPLFTDFVEVIVSDEAKQRGTEGMVYDDLEMPAALQLPGPLAHQEAANALYDCLVRLI